MNPLPADRALDQYFLEARSRLLDVAAILDRISRGGSAAALASDQRLARIDRAIEVLGSSAPNKAEQIQQLFSLEYDANWKRPQPRF